MATLATLPVVQPVNRISGLLPPPSKQIQTCLEETDPGAILAGLAVVPLALLAVVLWPVLFMAGILLLVVLTPFVIGLWLLASIVGKGRVFACKVLEMSTGARRAARHEAANYG